MKKLALIICGFSPFLFGWIMNWAMMTVFYDSVIPFQGIGLAFLLIWGVVAYLLRRLAASSKELLVLLNLPALAVLVLLFIQEILLSAYWRNAVGYMTQLFYLPLLNIAFSLTFWAHRVFPAYAVAFVLMVTVSYLCGKLREKMT